MSEKATDLQNRFAEMYLKKKELEAQLKEINEQIEQMSEALVNVFLDAGIQNVRLKGGVTLRIDRKVWPKIHGSTDDVIDAIKKAGLIDLLAKETYQSNSLARFLRDLDETGDELPQEFSGVIEANPVYKIIPTRS